MSVAERQRYGWVNPDDKLNSPLRINNSTFSVIAQCSTAALLKWYGWSSAEETAAMRAGTAAHAAIACHLEEGSDPLTVFDEWYKAWSLAEVPPDSRLTWRNTRTILAAWLDAHPPSALPFVTKHVEIPFEVPLDAAGEFILTGQLDGIAELRETGDILVLEHKTTGYLSAWWASQFRLGSQGSGYTWAAKRHLGGQRVVGFLVNAIEFSRLPADPVRKCKAHGVVFAECGALHAKWQLIGPIQRTPQQLAMWRGSALALARQFRDLLLQHPTLDSVLEVAAEGQFNGSCRGCSGADWCETGRDPAMLPSLMQQQEA